MYTKKLHGLNTEIPARIVQHKFISASTQPSQLLFFTWILALQDNALEIIERIIFICKAYSIKQMSNVEQYTQNLSTRALYMSLS